VEIMEIMEKKINKLIEDGYGNRLIVANSSYMLLGPNVPSDIPDHWKGYRGVKFTFRTKTGDIIESDSVWNLGDDIPEVCKDKFHEVVVVAINGEPI